MGLADGSSPSCWARWRGGGAGSVASAAPWTISALSDGTDGSPAGVGRSSVRASRSTAPRSPGTPARPDCSTIPPRPSAWPAASSCRVDTSSDVIGPNKAVGHRRGPRPAWRQPTRRVAAERPDDPGRRQPDRRVHPHQPAAGHQLRLRLGGVRGVRRLQFNDVFAFYVNGVNCALTPGTTDPITINTVNQDSNTLFYVPNDDRRPTTPSSTASPWSSRVAPRSIPASRTRCAWSSPIPATASSTPACSSRRTVSRRTRSGRCSRSRRTGCSTPVMQATTAGSSLGLSTQSIVPAGTSISVKVTGGDVPDTALAVALNVTAVDGAGTRVPDDLPGWWAATWHVECELPRRGRRRRTPWWRRSAPVVASESSPMPAST